MSDELLEGEALIEVGKYRRIMTQRQWASSVIARVAGHCEYGSYPTEISGFDLGRALHRALINSSEQDAVLQVVKGLLHGAKRDAELRYEDKVLVEAFELVISQIEDQVQE